MVCGETIQVRETVKSTELIGSMLCEDSFSGDSLHSALGAWDLERLTSSGEEQRAGVEKKRAELVAALQDLLDATVSTGNREHGMNEHLRLRKLGISDITPCTDFLKFMRILPPPSITLLLSDACMSTSGGESSSDAMVPPRRQLKNMFSRGNDLVYLPLIPEEDFLSNTEAQSPLLREKLLRLGERMVGGAYMVGSNPLNPFSSSSNPQEKTAQLINSILSTGTCGYVCQSEPHEYVLGTLDRNSAWHDLGEFFATSDSSSGLGNKHVPREKRLKDVCRLLRMAKRQNLGFQFAVNVDSAEAVRCLREYHPDNWVGKSLVDVWTLMQSHGIQLMQSGCEKNERKDTDFFVWSEQ